MDLVAWVIAGILAVDLLIVAGFVGVELLDRRRIDREVRTLNALWRAPSVDPIVRRPQAVMTRQRPITAVATDPRTVGSAALTTALVSMLILIVVAAVGGSPPATRTLAERIGASPAPQATDYVRPHRAPSPEASVRPKASKGADPVGSSADDPSVVAAASVPDEVAATASSWGSIVIEWTAVPNATVYRVERNSTMAADGGWSLVAEIDAAKTTFVDQGVESTTTYFYRVSAVIENETAPPSDVISVTTPVDAPSETSVTAIAVSDSEIQLRWDDVGGEDGYRIERRASGSSGWTTIATTGADVITHSDGALDPDTKYKYRVFAENEGGESDASNVAQATTFEEASATESPPDAGGADGAGTSSGPGKSKRNGSKVDDTEGDGDADQIDPVATADSEES